MPSLKILHDRTCGIQCGCTVGGTRSKNHRGGVRVGKTIVLSLVRIVHSNQAWFLQVYCVQHPAVAAINRGPEEEGEPNAVQAAGNPGAGVDKDRTPDRSRL